ncbi:MAG: TolC family protein [Bacteroidales bacterium]|nr:TolC family protein [Bacteroidales bacterium]
MKKTVFSVILILLVSVINAQNPVRFYSLETVVDSALKHYAINGQAAIHGEIFDLQSSKINAEWKPQLILNGKASYQSDVTRVEIPIPGFNAPEIAKDWYQINLDITQTIYDGGMSKQRKAIEEAAMALALKNIDQQRYHFRQQIHNLYYQALLYEQQIKVQQSAVNCLDTLIEEMNSVLMTGMILQSELNTLKVEKLKLLQQKTAGEAGRKSALAMLATYSGLPIAAADSLMVPDQDIRELTILNHRPELEAFSLQQEQLQQQESLSKSTRNPVIQAFGQAGYGRPGFNMLEDDFTPYAMAGIRFHYRLFDWNSNQKERKIIRLNAQNLELAKQDFKQNISAAAHAKLEEIKQYQILIEQGDTIILLQQEILQTSESKLKNGTITSANYVTELEKYQQSQLIQHNNKLQLQLAIDTFNFITGNIQSNEAL